jgi:hypothetical protein
LKSMLKYVPVPVLLLFAISTSVTLGAEPASSPVAVPPALQALEQKMLLINFNTARVSAVFALGDLGAPVEGAELGADANKCNSLVSYTTATERLSPPASIGAVEIDGGTAVKQITVGKTSYIYMPSAERYDGGRPWVRQVLASKPSGNPALSALSTLSQEQPTTSTGFFQNLVEEINDSSSIKEIGARTVDEQQTTEFTATVPMATLLARRLSQNQIEAVEKKDKAFKGVAKAIVTLELYVAPSGMPVRTIDVIGSRNEGIGVEQDILATGVPATINAPSARLTIGQARLDKLIKRYAKSHHRQPLAPQNPFSTGPAHCPSESNEASEHLPIQKSAPGVPRTVANFAVGVKIARQNLFTPNG